MHTTAHIRRVARDEILDRGPRALSLSSVARRSFVSVGAVYERWPTKVDCITDVLLEVLPTAVTVLVEPWRDPRIPVADVVRQGLQDPGQLRALRLVVAGLLAARDVDALRPQVQESIGVLARAAQDRLQRTPRNDACGWWVAATWTGFTLLTDSGCPLPDTFADTVATIMSSSGTGTGTLRPRPPAVQMPPREQDGRDQTTEALLESARRVLAHHGTAGADLRTIARDAGVSTGAIYRRFAGRSDLLVRAFSSSVDPMVPMGALAVGQVLDDPSATGARGLLTRLWNSPWADERQAHLIVEFAAMAGADPMIRDALVRQLTAAAQQRQDVLRALQETDALRGDLPADALAWCIQVAPVGMQLLAAAGVTPTGAAAQEAAGVSLDAVLSGWRGMVGGAATGS